MTTRTIVTSQPDVACELCARRLLRGEQHEIFLADGRPRTVCELCAPRAADAGWVRDRDGQAALAPIAAPRRGRGFLERLRLGSRAGEQRPGESRTSESQARESRARESQARESRARESRATGVGAGESRPAGEGFVATAPDEPVPGAALAAAPSAGHAIPAPAVSPLERAAVVFNESEYPRRVAGLMRSLGAPAVCVRPAEHLAGAVLITLAWELCWYRYEIDMTEDPAPVRPLEQGTELAQLSREERHANAHVAADGTVFL
ncbi:MAG TPA: hypothetical protein VMI13_09625 [Solirubrobacteraceae bacterium]|nr:hypothetical protein [Solirubrobacteraceae bacterium]